MTVGTQSFLTNMFKGISILSAFQLAKGDFSSIAVLPSSPIFQEIFDARAQVVADCAIPRALWSRRAQGVKPLMLYEEMRI